jgi:hypothetical protein
VRIFFGPPYTVLTFRSDKNELYGNSNQTILGITTGRSGGGGGITTNSDNNYNSGQTGRSDQAQVEAALQNDRAAREEMEAGLSALMQQLRHNALAIHQTLVDEQKSGVSLLSSLLLSLL